MRIQYFFTSELDEVADKIKFQLEYFSKKSSVDKQLKNIIQNLEGETLNYSTFFNKVDDFRKQISKLDLLLQESKDIMVVCQRAEHGEYDQEVENGAPREGAEQAAPPEEKNKKEERAGPPKEEKKMQEFKSAMGQLTDMAAVLKELKGGE